MNIKHKNGLVIDGNSVRIYDEHGYELTHSDDIKEWNKRNLLSNKNKVRLNKEYALSRWGKEVVNILQEKGQMKNIDIMQELYKRSYDGRATHIKEFFKSKDGKQFYKNQLNGNDGYWSLRDKER